MTFISQAAYRGTVSVLVAPALDTQPTIRI